MDNNNFKLNSNDTGTDIQPVENQNPGYDQQTFGTGNTYGTYDSVNSGNTYGTYNAVNPGNINATGSNGTYVPQGESSPFMQEADKKAKSGLIIGIITIVLNLIFCAIPFIFDWVFSPGWIFIFVEIVGIQNANQGRQSANKKGMAITGMVLNIVSLVWSILLVILVLILKFANIAN